MQYYDNLLVQLEPAAAAAVPARREGFAGPEAGAALLGEHERRVHRGGGRLGAEVVAAEILVFWVGSGLDQLIQLSLCMQEGNTDDRA